MGPPACAWCGDVAARLSIRPVLDGRERVSRPALCPRCIARWFPQNTIPEERPELARR
jgi:hypothetical protein